ncbi:GNAT family acetyltransferase [Listeria weihenstephanensis FSL R9-0317]|uniref:GNAT family acetyltransferase n=1 Tax=Listeria weihenstephanensis TaxID=1006155 RepID=A0A1S7FUW2_9LIST|nr:GNAT family N-acetyltransferase [Listeria weihenstephanensis]AQY51147.1 GNAT family acetyltransferase [Listeria weihenstephanensis]EUJ36924.1 GNAT family acetyltransferase [Listeria weihenstephanensis FSL R9-0317]
MYIRLAKIEDAKRLAEIRLQIDGETENMDRERGEDFLDEVAFQEIIKIDTTSVNNLFLVAEITGELVGFSRCEGTNLNRSKHKVMLGVAVVKDHWGKGVGPELLRKSIHWADRNSIRKITLTVLETNRKAIEMYTKFGFEIEGRLKADKKLADGNYYDTYVMSRNKKQ